MTLQRSNADFQCSFSVTKEPEIVYQSIVNFRGWWSEEIEGITDILNETFFYHYQDVHRCTIRMIEDVPFKKIVYQVLENHFSFVKDQDDWVDSKLIFEIESKNGNTGVFFKHEGLTPENECYPVCHEAWTGYIEGSLKDLITTGKGRPNPKQGGFNAELVNKWELDK